MPRPATFFTLGKWKIIKCTLCNWKGRVPLDAEQKRIYGYPDIQCPECAGNGYKRERVKNGKEEEG